MTFHAIELDGAEPSRDGLVPTLWARCARRLEASCPRSYRSAEKTHQPPERLFVGVCRVLLFSFFAWQLRIIFSALENEAGSV